MRNVGVQCHIKRKNTLEEKTFKDAIKMANKGKDVTVTQAGESESSEESDTSKSVATGMTKEDNLRKTAHGLT